MLTNESNLEAEDKAQYTVVSVEKIETPDGMQGKNWYEYVIGYGRSQIVGKKSGSRNAVSEHAQTVADDLNARAKKGGSYAATSQRQKK